ncbi:MAG: glycosyltransferase family 4 protein [Planctomycetota bacterium]
MRIVQLTPGSGDNFYCENCLRDLAMVKAFQRAGHEMTLVPMYLPIKMDAEVAAAAAPLFMGGLNVYLQQKMGLFRKTPRWLDKYLDNPKLLKKLGKMSGMTTARELGAATVSMLEGADGKQQKEIDRLIDWLATLPDKPEVIIISNILLAGLAPAIKQKLDVKVVCLLQDEEDFLDMLPQVYSDRAWQLVSEQSQAFDLFISVSEFYKRRLGRRVEIDPQKMIAMPMGLEPELFKPSLPPEEPVVGYLSQMCYDHGLDILINAVHLLRRDQRLKNIKLRITGGKSAADKSFLNHIDSRIHNLRLTGCVEFIEDYGIESRRAFLESLSLMVLPTRKPLAYGLCALESLAAGVPFVSPDTGAFAEIANNTQAAVLYEPNNPVKLAETLRPLLTEPELIAQLGQKGAAAVKEKYAIDETVRQMIYRFGLLTDKD